MTNKSLGKKIVAAEGVGPKQRRRKPQDRHPLPAGEALVAREVTEIVRIRHYPGIGTVEEERAKLRQRLAAQQSWLSSDMSFFGLFDAVNATRRYESEEVSPYPSRMKANQAGRTLDVINELLDRTTDAGRRGALSGYKSRCLARLVELHG